MSSIISPTRVTGIALSNRNRIYKLNSRLVEHTGEWHVYFETFRIIKQEHKKHKSTLVIR